MSFYKETRRTDKKNYDRYRDCNVLQSEDGTRFLATRDIIDIPISREDIYHTVQANEEYRLDIIAYQYYKNPLLWWVLAQANNIYDTINHPVSGDVIRIPSLYTLYGTRGILL